MKGGIQLFCIFLTLVNLSLGLNKLQYLRKPIVWKTEKELLQKTEFQLLKELVIHTKKEKFESTHDFLTSYLFPEFIKKYTIHHNQYYQSLLDDKLTDIYHDLIVNYQIGEKQIFEQSGKNRQQIKNDLERLTKGQDIGDTDSYLENLTEDLKREILALMISQMRKLEMR